MYREVVVKGKIGICGESGSYKKLDRKKFFLQETWWSRVSLPSKGPDYKGNFTHPTQNFYRKGSRNFPKPNYCKHNTLLNLITILPLFFHYLPFFFSRSYNFSIFHSFPQSATYLHFTHNSTNSTYFIHTSSSIFSILNPILK